MNTKVGKILSQKFKFDGLETSISVNEESDIEEQIVIVERHSFQKCPRVAPDGGWAWVVLFAAFSNNMIADGLNFSYGILILSLIDYFKMTHFQAGWISSLAIGFTLLNGPVASILVSISSLRKVALTGSLIAAFGIGCGFFINHIAFTFICFGVLVGTGLGFLYLPGMVSISQYFTTKLPIATGISSCGSGCGMFVFTILLPAILDKYDWQGTTLILSGIVLHSIVFSLLLLPLDTYGALPAHDEDCKEPVKKPIISASVANFVNSIQIMSVGGPALIQSIQRSQSTFSDKRHSIQKSQATITESIKQETRALFDFRLLRDPSLRLFYSATFLFSLGFSVPFAFIVDLGKHKGVSEAYINYLLTALGVTNTLSRLLFGCITGCAGINNYILLSCVYGFCGVLLMLTPLYVGFPAIFFLALSYGFCIGGIVVLQFIVMSQLMDVTDMASGIGLQMMLIGIPTFFAAPFAGLLYDFTGSYDLPFGLAGVTIFLAGIVMIPICHFIKKR